MDDRTVSFKICAVGVAAFRDDLKVVAPGRAFAFLTRQKALFLPLVGGKLSSTPTKLTVFFKMPQMQGAH